MVRRGSSGARGPPPFHPALFFLSLAGTFRIGATPVDYPTCPNGFTVLFQATRSNDNSLWAQCTATVAVLQVRASLRKGPRRKGPRSNAPLEWR